MVVKPLMRIRDVSTAAGLAGPISLPGRREKERFRRTGMISRLDHVQPRVLPHAWCLQGSVLLHDGRPTLMHCRCDLGSSGTGHEVEPQPVRRPSHTVRLAAGHAGQ